jgi:hypothetical protein
MAGRRRRRPSAAAREADDTRAELTAEAAVNKAAAARAKEERAALLARQAERKAEKAEHRAAREAGQEARQAAAEREKARKKAEDELHARQEDEARALKKAEKAVVKAAADAAKQAQKQKEKDEKAEREKEEKEAARLERVTPRSACEGGMTSSGEHMLEAIRPIVSRIGEEDVELAASLAPLVAEPPSAAVLAWCTEAATALNAGYEWASDKGASEADSANFLVRAHAFGSRHRGKMGDALRKLHPPGAQPGAELRVAVFDLLKAVA